MSIELSEDERKLVIQASEHYDAYLHATSRRDGHAKELAENLSGQLVRIDPLHAHPHSAPELEGTVYGGLWRWWAA